MLSESPSPQHHRFEMQFWDPEQPELKLASHWRQNWKIYSAIIFIFLGLIGLFIMIPLLVDKYEHKKLAIGLKGLDQKSLNQSKRSMKVLSM